MWTPLQHPRQVEFYEEAHAGRYDPREGYLPMIRAVRYLQAHRDAPRLFAFTSLSHFHVTTAPTYAECSGHDYVCITWAWADGLFRLAFGSCDSGWADEPAYDTCPEQDFPSAVEPLIERLLQSPPTKALNRNA
jgi:hypothetical protein